MSARVLRLPSLLCRATAAVAAVLVLHSAAPAQTARARVAEGLAAYNEGQYAQARRHFAGAVKKYPNHAPALNNLGVMLARLGRLRNAIVFYDRALLADGDNGVIWNNRANAHCRLKMVDEAVEDRLLALTYNRFTIRSAKVALSNHGHYRGLINDVWDGAASEALHAWTTSGCPRPPKTRLLSG